MICVSICVLIRLIVTSIKKQNMKRDEEKFTSRSLREGEGEEREDEE